VEADKEMDHPVQLATRDRPEGARELLPTRRMEEVATTLAKGYSEAQPFPHIVLDNFFDEWILDRILAEFPRPGEGVWEKHDIAEEIKLQSRHERYIPTFTRQFLYSLNSATFLDFLEHLTAIDKLIGDPRFEGGGLHQITRGGKLAIHVDFNRQRYFGLNRRLNLLVYLNKGWKEEYGGHFELWNSEMSQMVKKIAPVFNRVVIFSTTDTSFHGHPDPLNCPADTSRKSLALYYYTVGANTAASADLAHNTLFQKRPGERFRSSSTQLVRDLTPPILWRMLSRRFKS